MNYSEIRLYLLDIAMRLEVLANVLHCSSDIVDNSRFEQPAFAKIVLDGIIYEELKAMSGMIIDDIKEEE